MSYQEYFETAAAALQRVAEQERENITRAAQLMADAIVGGQSLYAFGASHSFILAEEMVYRTGGLMLVNPIYPHGMNLFVRPLTATSRWERILGLGKEILASSTAKAGDVLIIASTSGRNAVVIDMAMAAREQGIQTIGITSRAYSEGVSSRHPSGKKLLDLCDVVIDNGAPLWRRGRGHRGLPQRIGPLSPTGCAIVNALAVAVVERLVKQGVTPASS